MSQDGALPQDGFIRLNRLVPHVIPYSRATIWRKVKAGEFPKPVKLTARITAWRVSDIRQWIEKRGAEGGEKA